MDVRDPMPDAKAPVVVSKVERHKDIVLLDVSESWLHVHISVSYRVSIYGISRMGTNHSD